jgi:hypothetical protein
MIEGVIVLCVMVGLVWIGLFVATSDQRRK